jgi:methyl-accepting chemotaxis protein
MLSWTNSKQLQNSVAQATAISRSQAVIEFNMDGTIVTANENFLKALGYPLSEIQGRHHSMFVDPSERESVGYREFWASLNRGEYQAAEYKRVGKDGKEIWIQASYNPILDSRGKPAKVIKFATDITAQKIRSMENLGKIAAMDRSQAVIEFNMDGTIVTANENFLNAVGYALGEVQGRHHSMFVEPSERESVAYREFWASLNRGEYQAAEYKRFGKGGKEVWILATYNPILNEKGKPFKVVKFATEVTAQKLKAADLDGQITAIGKSQAVIEFRMDGTIITANENFLGTLGYSLGEVQGRHHSMFVEPAERGSSAYQEFWARLNRGEYQAAEYKRIGKGGKEVWIQASYNPIMDLNGKPFKVVKYAADTTQQALTRMRAERARSLIESVAAGSEEMSASILEISSTMVKSRQTATESGNASRFGGSAGPAAHIGGAIDGRHCRSDRQHYRPDQSACAQCDDRVRPRRRGGPGVRGGGVGSEEPRQPGETGNRQDLERNCRPQPDLGRCRHRPRLDQEGDRARQPVRHQHGRGR